MKEKPNKKSKVMANNAVDIETLKFLAEMMKPSTPVVTTTTTSAPVDRDSFASFTGGIRQNWTILAALVGVGFWAITNILSIQNINITQDGNIERNAKAIEVLTTSLTSFQTAANSSNNEIVRRLDNLQKDLEIIKAQQK